MSPDALMWVVWMTATVLIVSGYLLLVQHIAGNLRSELWLVASVMMIVAAAVGYISSAMISATS